MSLSNEILLVILVVGLVAGWSASQFVRGTGYGLTGDLLIGIPVALIGDWLFHLLHFHLGVGFVALVVDATIGAISLLLILRLVRGGGRWGGGLFDRRWW